jgi:hypothetical protein
MISSVSRLWSRTINASLPTTTSRLFSTTSATRLAAPYTEDMGRVPTGDRLHKLRELMQSHKVDIYSTNLRRHGIVSLTDHLAQSSLLQTPMARSTSHQPTHVALSFLDSLDQLALL